MRHITIIVLSFLLFISCVGYKTHKYPKPINDDNQKRVTVTDHVDFYTKSGEDQLEYAQQFFGEGNYQTAIVLFLDIYQNALHKPEVRQRALLNLGYIYSSVLFSGKDYDKAFFYWRILLKEFPETEFRAEVERAIENIQRLISER